ncbi:acetyl-CoA carboxylase carboxyltransferase subunit alpha [Actinomycetes bacterium KLBMP 9797]
MTVTAQSIVEKAAPPDEWCRCPGCGAFLYWKRLHRNAKVCPECQHHLRMSLDERLAHVLDPDSFVPLGPTQEPVDVLAFVDSQPYPRRLATAARRTGRPEAATYGVGAIQGARLAVVALDFGFMGGSIGAVVGEAVVQAAELARIERIPLLVICASGGARMQEGALALMQLARTAQEIARLHEEGVLVINLNTHPTFGGATASFATLGDVVLAEPGSLIGFAGPQVIRQTIRQELPAGFQTAEFLQEHGMVDLVVPRDHLRETIGRIIRLHGPSPRVPAGPASPAVTDPAALTRAPAWDVVGRARHLARPTTLDYLRHAFEDFVELHGDRAYRDDAALVAGVARLAGRHVVVVGHQKGHDTAELVRRNFGMPHPEGYRKALRMMRHAARFGLPLVTFVDTPGAFPGLEAEERGQGTIIAECIAEMSRLPVPAVSVVTGEGGSGGALALAVADRVLMLEHSYYSVISPEGCSTILWGSAASAASAAQALRLTAPDLLRLGVVDAVVPEPAGGAHADPPATAAAVARAVTSCLDELAGRSAAELVEQRYQRFRTLGPAGVIA